jgi:hypothetical protein
MTTSDPQPDALKASLAKSVAAETGITETQALNLIEMIGTDRSSLIREARVLRNLPGATR